MRYRLLIYSLLIAFLLPSIVHAEDSICFGSTRNGKLINGVQLPLSGNNFTSYSYLAALLGRIYVHGKVYKVILDAYKEMENKQPKKVFKYMETGFERGGEFKPHKTHQNGLSVDFMVPVTDQSGESVHLSTHPLNKYGYSIEFNNKGHYETLTIDFESMAMHIVALHQSARKNKIDIWRVIFDPQLQPKLFATSKGAYLKRYIEFSKKKSWVRHDEHYHVDFKVKCKKM